jgi:hypothetical protein
MTYLDFGLGDFQTCTVKGCHHHDISADGGLGAVASLIVLSVNASQGIVPCGLWSNAIIYIPFHHVLGDYHTCAVSEQCCCMVVAMGGLVGLAAVACLIILSVNAGQGIIPCGLWSNAIIDVPFQQHVLGDYHSSAVS